MTSETTAPTGGLTSGSPGLRRLNLAMMCAALAAFGLLYSTQALLPPIGAAFGVGPTAAALTVSAATGSLALAIVPLSSVAESVGRVPVMRAGLLVACLATFVAALAPWFWLLLVARGLVGVALAAVVAVAVAHLGDEVHPAELGTAIGVYVAGNTLGGITGRLVPGLVEESSSWRAAVALLGVVAALAAVAFTRLLPSPRRTSSTVSRPRDHVSAVRSLVADPGVVRLCVLAFVLMGGFVACYNYLTFRLEAPPLAMSTTVTSLLFLAYLAGTVSSPLAGRLADRYGRRRLALAGIAVSLAGLALTLPDRVLLVTVGLVVFTFGFFATHAVASGWVSARGTGRRGQAAAMYLMSYYLGSSAFGALIGLAYQYDGWPATAAAIAALYVVAAVVVPKHDPAG
ncbi:MAG: MFS transporter [Nocardioidaceae bacterium]|nr:MFS transporter [Nocardioidaceae bacterium]NUS52586.1 MFS transporter [Nocardioidaceae bacterium]